MRAYWLTDGDWYRFLRGLAGIDEVNFSQPRGERVRMQGGQPFLFNLHYPKHLTWHGRD